MFRRNKIKNRMFRKISFNTTLRLINCGGYRIREHCSFYPPNVVGVEIRSTSITARRERKSKIQCFGNKVGQAGFSFGRESAIDDFEPATSGYLRAWQPYKTCASAALGALSDPRFCGSNQAKLLARVYILFFHHIKKFIIFLVRLVLSNTGMMIDK